MSRVVYEKQKTDISWYSNPIRNGTAKDNFERIIELRKAFCHKLTINRDGTLNKKYFSTQTKETAMNWNDIELLQLYEGIYQHGVDSVDKWHKIANEFLPRRDFIEVRLKLSQLFGIQDLSIYKNRIFKTEKEISDEFEKNKQEAINNNTWNQKCEIALRPSVAKLNKNETEKLDENELEHWKKNVYNNPLYVYRVLNQYDKKSKKGKKSKKKNTKNNANKNKKKTTEKIQKNTLTQMFQKDTNDNNNNNNNNKKKVQFAENIAQNKEFEKMQVDKNKKKNKNENKEVEDENMEDKEVKVVETKPKKVKKKAKKVSKRKGKKVPLLPEDSSDEDMLCVE